MSEIPFAPSAERNKTPILEVLKRVIPKGVRVLEIGSGTGQHARHFAEDLDSVSWQPSEVEEEIATLLLGLQQSPGNVRSPVTLDVRNADWPVTEFDVVFTANTLHIMSWQAVTALFSGLGRNLPAGGFFVVYGPFKYDGQHTADSNQAFDIGLRQKARQMGIRDLVELDALARMAGMALRDDFEMPANNRVLVFERNREPENERVEV